MRTDVTNEHGQRLSHTNHDTMDIRTTLRHLAFIPLLCSFTPPDVAAPPTAHAGTYGVCGCAGAEERGAPTLTLATDGSFVYQDHSDASAPVDASGRWVVRGRKVQLDIPATKGLARTWTLDVNDACIRSRKGLLFTRLCRLDACKGAESR